MSIRYFEHQVLEIHLAHRVVRLERKRPAGQLPRGAFEVLGFRVIRGDFAIDHHEDVFALDDNLKVEPFAVLSRRLEVVLDVVQAPRFLGVAVRVVHLRFVACLGPSFRLKMRMKVDAGVRLGHRLDLGLKMKIPAFVMTVFPDIERMASGTVDDQTTVLNSESTRVLTNVPTHEILSVEE